MTKHLDKESICELQEDNKIFQDNQTEQEKQSLSTEDKRLEAQFLLGDNRLEISTSNENNQTKPIKLRPNSAIIKHNINDTQKNNKAVPAPAWFFNIPTTRSPFPDINGIITQE